MDYEVGKGKPPVHTRFSPGVSGNPSGKNKGSKNKRTAINESLKLLGLTPNEIKSIKTSKRSVLEIMFISTLNDAVKGDKDARREIFSIIKPAINFNDDEAGDNSLPGEEYQKFKQLISQDGENE